MKPLRQAGPIAVFLAVVASTWAQTAPAPDAATPSAAASPATAPLPQVPYAPPMPSVAQNVSVAGDMDAGESALANGFYPLATYLFKQELSKPDLPQAMRDALNLDLVTASLAQSDVANAAAALKAIVTAVNSPGYLLRAALLQELGGKWDDARTQFDRVDFASLPPVDQPLYYMAQAALAEQRQDLDGATAAWTHAIERAATLTQADKFKAALERAKILLDPAAAPGDAPALEKQLQDPNLDAGTHAKLVCELAVIYDKLSRGDDARKLLSNELMRVDLPRESLDALRLEYVILDGAGATPEKAADDVAKLKNILDDWPETDAPDYTALLHWQEMALALLQNELAGNPASLPTDLEAYIKDKVEDKRGHPLLKQLYLLQAQLELVLAQSFDPPGAVGHSPAAAAHYAAADVAAQKLLDLPSGVDHDPARDSAWNTRYIVALNQTPPQYRDAASDLLNLYKSLFAAAPDSLETRQVTARLADLDFLNGITYGDPQDYLQAAKYYSGLLGNPPPETDRGTLLVRAVESNLKAGQVDEARALLDQTVAQYTIDPNDRWRAEYNVLLAMQDRGPAGAAQAFTRLEGYLDDAHADQLPASLQLYLRWLDAKLALEIGDPAALQKGKNLQDVAENVLKMQVVIPGLNAHELAAQGLLYQMEAQSRAGHAKEEGDLFALLNGPDYADTEAAVSAKIDIAGELALQNKYGLAEPMMIDLADKLDKATQAEMEKASNLRKPVPGAEFAPTARFAAAQDAEYLNTNNQYDDALRILRGFVDSYDKNLPYYAQNPLIYLVVEEQGLLKSKSGDFDAAKGYFDKLIDMLEQDHRPDSDAFKAGVLKLRAQCLIALAGESAGDREKRTTALDALERLYEKTELPVGVRIWAGVDDAWLTETDPEQAPTQVKTAEGKYWKVINTFLVDPKMRAALDQDPDGRDWMARGLTMLGNLEQQKLHDANSALKAYHMILDYNLGREKDVQPLINAVAPSPASPPASAAAPAANPPASAPPSASATAN